MVYVLSRLVWRRLGGTGVSYALIAFHIWMLIEAIRRGVTCGPHHLFFPVINDFLYFFLVYWQSGGGMRRRASSFRARRPAADFALKAEIHHLDKPHMHLQLADIILARGSLKEAEKSYRAAYERDRGRGHSRASGNCLHGATAQERCRCWRASSRRTRSTITATRR